MILSITCSIPVYGVDSEAKMLPSLSVLSIVITMNKMKADMEEKVHKVIVRNGVYMLRITKSGLKQKIGTVMRSARLEREQRIVKHQEDILPEFYCVPGYSVNYNINMLLLLANKLISDSSKDEYCSAMRDFDQRKSFSST